MTRPTRASQRAARQAHRRSAVPKLPTTVRVAHLDFAVEYRPVLSEEGEASSDDMGQYRLGDMTILVRDTLPPAQQTSTLWHEVLHAVSDVYCAGLSERQVRALETGLLVLLRDNPALLAAVLPKP